MQGFTHNIIFIQLINKWMSRLLELRMARRAIKLLTELERMLFIAGCPRKLFISGCPRINNLIGTFPCLIFFI